MLNAIRIGQPISRADLARQIGLQRSTVSLIVEQLMNERWIVEGGVAQLPRGRRPRLLTLDVEKAGIIGVNVMPEATTLVLADLNSTFRAQESFVTPDEPARLVRALAERIRRLRELHPETAFEEIGVSLPGRVDRHTQRLAFAPNLSWPAGARGTAKAGGSTTAGGRDVDLKTPLEEATGLPVSIENAANACALSEVWSGPFAGAQDLIAVTVSEGIGTGIISNGQLVRGPSGAAGEFGHVTIDPEGPMCNCGSRGCWEALASNSAAVRAYNERLQTSRQSRSRLKKLEGGASVQEFGDILSLAERGDVMAQEVLDRMGKYLGQGLAMLVTGLAPGVITIVGEVTRAWGRVGPVMQKVVRERAHSFAVTRIVPTNDIMQPRLRGTVALVLQKHFQPRMLS